MFCVWTQAKKISYNFYFYFVNHTFSSSKITRSDFRLSRDDSSMLHNFRKNAGFRRNLLVYYWSCVRVIAARLFIQNYRAPFANSPTGLYYAKASKSLKESPFSSHRVCMCPYHYTPTLVRRKNSADLWPKSITLTRIFNIRCLSAMAFYYICNCTYIFQLQRSRRRLPVSIK